MIALEWPVVVTAVFSILGAYVWLRYFEARQRRAELERKMRLRESISDKG